MRDGKNTKWKKSIGNRKVSSMMEGVYSRTQHMRKKKRSGKHKGSSRGIINAKVRR